MFKSLQDYFNSKISSLSESPDSQSSDEQELELAAATLMFEVARADGKVDVSELNTMGAILDKHFDFNSEEIATMIELAQASSDKAISLQGFTRRVCDNWDNAKRIKLLEHLWLIALADDTIDSHERHLVRKIAGLLYLTENQIFGAKERAKAIAIENA